MYKLYLIVTCVLAGVFAIAYIPANSARVERERAAILKKEEEERQRLAEQVRIQQEAAAADAMRREEREQQELADERKAIEEWTARNEKRIEQTTTARADTRRLNDEIAAKRRELDQARERRLAVGREAFDLRRSNELLKIQIRNAQLDAQRGVDLVALRSNAAAPAFVPPLPPAPKTN